MPRPKGKVRMRAFTETSGVRLVASAGDFAFVAKRHGLERWSGSDVLVLSSDHGLPGDTVIGMASDRTRGWLWIITDGGLAYYDTRSESLYEVPPAPSSLGLGFRTATPPARMAAAAAGDGGVWLGHTRGLFYTTPSGAWTSTPITDPVTALHLDHDGWLWIGTDRGLVGRRPDGKTFTFGAEQGNEVVATRLIASAPGGGVMVVGEDGNGRQRVALGHEPGWVSYKVSPNQRWSEVAALADRLVVRADDGLYQLTPGHPGAHRPLSRNGARLLPLAGGAGEPLQVDRLAARLPSGAAALAATDTEILVGTGDIGVARLVPDAARPSGWYRRAEMVRGAHTLTVHCLAKQDCWLATGAPRAWRWRGTDFEPAGPPDHVVLALVRGPDGALYGLHRSTLDAAIQVSSIDGDEWTATGIELTTPGTRPEVSFARFAPSGELWVGLRFHDSADDETGQPWGVAIVDLALGAVAYHHASGDRRELARGVLPVPVTVVDAAFLGDDQVWMASLEGAVRLKGDDVTVWNEGMELDSELLTAVAVSRGGLVFVATPAGVGTFDGERWRFPPALHWPVNDLDLADDGRLWMATERGIAIYDGKRVRRIDVRRGLVENDVRNVTIDEFGRVWARGPRSLTMITP